MAAGKKNYAIKTIKLSRCYLKTNENAEKVEKSYSLQINFSFRIYQRISHPFSLDMMFTHRTFG